MAAPSSLFPRHIAAGCLYVPRADTHLSDAQWLELSRCWRPFYRPDKQLESSANTPGGKCIDLDLVEAPSGLNHLPSEIQKSLFDSALVSIAKLFQHHWIELEFKVSEYEPSADALVRVYLLPQDLDRRLVNRSSKPLRKSWNSLLARLSFEKSAWEGKPHGDPAHHPALEQPDDGHESDLSLLELFNTIPSPDPTPELLLDCHERDDALSILNGQIPSVKTALFPYQRRSAAVMLQRESQPTQCLDPRLRRVVDQNSTPWFYDPIAGEVLKDARYYDGTTGGILAEEMGAGKTLICLALIAATRHQPAFRPDTLTAPAIVRPRMGSLADMAASAGSMASVPWGSYFSESQVGDRHYDSCHAAIERNPGWYLVPRPAPRRGRRQPTNREPSSSSSSSSIKVYLARASLVIVPTNLLEQWKDEIAKHTTGLRTLVLAAGASDCLEAPEPLSLLQYDIILVAMSRFERLIGSRVQEKSGIRMFLSSLAQVHFKRIIIDEGHKLGNSTMGKKSNLLLILDHLHASSRWVVTGTPSKGLYGTDGVGTGTGGDKEDVPRRVLSSEQESKDLAHIGSIASLFLQARPWANRHEEDGDAAADWGVYVMQSKHNSRGRGSQSVLRSTLESLIIRHRKSEIIHLLPPIIERVVYLDGCYQDVMSLNLFAMMIIFNNVQSERVGPDSFFNPKNRSSLQQIVANERRASFFGASFFSAAEIHGALDTARDFLKAGKVPIDEEDGRLLREAIAFGQVAAANQLRDASNRCHEVPIYVQHLPGHEHDGVSSSWSIDNNRGGDSVCTVAPLVTALQRYIQPWICSPESLEIVFRTGKFASQGRAAQDKVFGRCSLEQAEEKSSAEDREWTEKDKTLNMGRTASLALASNGDQLETDAEQEIAQVLAKARLVATASAKLSYLIDEICKHKDEEKILVFYENANVAWYIAELLDMLHVPHLIYDKTLTPQRRAQYMLTFNETAKFRVMLMDLGQAAFGLDIKSASRIYFVNPVLNPQVEAQAIGRARRISQRHQVTVETLVLRGSLEELMIERKRRLTQAEHRRMRTILDDKPLYDWFLDARILRLPDVDPADSLAQMARLAEPLALFGRASAGVSHPDEDLVFRDGHRKGQEEEEGVSGGGAVSGKRVMGIAADGDDGPAADRKAKRTKGQGKGVRFAELGGE